MTLDEWRRVCQALRRAERDELISAQNLEDIARDVEHMRPGSDVIANLRAAAARHREEAGAFEQTLDVVLRERPPGTIPGGQPSAIIIAGPEGTSAPEEPPGPEEREERDRQR